jgi:hypothetical protein
MQKRQVIFFLMLPILLPMPTLAQGTMEFGAIHAGAIGLGAGLAASRSHGQVIRRSYEAMVQAEQATLAQTKAIEQYMKIGSQLESKKRWSDAEKSFTYVLKVVALRDGPGSIKSVPALQHLVSVSKQQGKLGEAIDFQKTVVAFTKSAKVPDQQAVLRSQIDLTNLFILKNDYTSAEPILRNTITSDAAYQSLPPEKRRVTLNAYAKVLRKLHKDAEADVLEAENTKLSAPKADVAAVLDKQADPSPTVVNAPSTNAPLTESAPSTAGTPVVPSKTLTEAPKPVETIMPHPDTQPIKASGTTPLESATGQK